VLLLQETVGQKCGNKEIKPSTIYYNNKLKASCLKLGTKLGISGKERLITKTMPTSAELQKNTSVDQCCGYGSESR
jgi:hypothetical protein